MVSVQVNDISVDVFKLDRSSGKSLTTAIEVIHTGDRLVEDDVAWRGVDGNLLDDVSVAAHGHGVDVPHARERQVEVPNGDEVDVARDAVVAVAQFARCVLMQGVHRSAGGDVRNVELGIGQNFKLRRGVD